MFVILHTINIKKWNQELYNYKNSVACILSEHFCKDNYFCQPPLISTATLGTQNNIQRLILVTVLLAND